MHEIVFIGDALTAAGFRLAGVESHAPEPEALTGTVERLRGEARVLAITAGAFEALPAGLRRALEAGDAPLLAVLPDVQGQAAPPDLEADVRRALGLEV